MLFGRGAMGDVLVKHKDVDGVSFTGSQGVGAQVAAAAVARQARVQLEMGGKNPLIILDDANIERFCDLLDAMVGETDTRYLIVTHNAVTMSRMHRLFGVTMVEKGVSRLVSVDLGGAEQLLAAE